MKNYFLFASLLFFQTASTAPKPLQVKALHNELQKLSHIELETFIEQIQKIYHDQVFKEEQSAEFNLRSNVCLGLGIACGIALGLFAMYYHHTRTTNPDMICFHQDNRYCCEMTQKTSILKFPGNDRVLRDAYISICHISQTCFKILKNRTNYATICLERR